jgi:hypothetical protein
VGAFPDGKPAVMLHHVAGTKWGTRRYLDINRLAEASEAARFLSGGDKLLAYDKAVSGGPKRTSEGLQLQRAPPVETRYRAVRRTAPIEPPDEFFLRSKAGSFDVFQVRTRWAVSPSRRSSRRTHSSVTAGNSFSSATVLGQLPNRPNRER